MNRFIIYLLIYFLGANLSLTQADSTQLKPIPKIQVVLLLDTSNSMDGLIGQVKSHLWNVINTITTLQFNDVHPELDIALYEYGNDELNPKEGYVRQIIPFSNDLDLISEHLFTLKTKGGNEYCGYAIQKAVKELEWDDHEASLRIIYIAGNEPFNQGNVFYLDAIELAKEKKIKVNTVYCGNEKEGKKQYWEKAAERAKGKYFSVDQDKKIKYISTPYDNSIRTYNTQLNQTYLGYGNFGKTGKKRQEKEDNHALQLSDIDLVNRAIVKTSGYYKNSYWDLVDAYNEEIDLSKLPKTDLPQELKQLPISEIEEKLKVISENRKKIQKKIKILAIKRAEFLKKENSNLTGVQDDLGKAITSSIVKLAEEKGYRVE